MNDQLKKSRSASLTLFIRVAALALVVGFAAPAFAADDASMHEVYIAAEAGKFNEAQAMMDKVLHDHPNSAKAHYVEAELLAKQGRLTGAADELNKAEQLKPGLPFVKPQALQKLKAQIGLSSAPKATGSNAGSHAASGNSLPWGLIMLGIGLLAFIYFIGKQFAQRNPPVLPANGYYGGLNNPQPYGGSAAPAPASGMGSGILGGLATGAALGAGMVAGEALMHHFTDGDHASGNGLLSEAQANDSQFAGNDMGGSDFGIADNSSWDDDSAGDDWS